MEQWKGKQLLDDPSNLLSYLAVPVDLAAKAWGFGLSATEQPSALPLSFKGTPLSSEFLSLCELRQREPGGAWTHEQRKALHDEAKRLAGMHGRNGVRLHLATALALADAEGINKQIRAYAHTESERSCTARGVISVRRMEF